jgi:hypothetical protein
MVCLCLDLVELRARAGDLDMAKTAADLIAATLQKAGVRRVDGVVGDSLNGFTYSLRRLKSIVWSARASA